MVRMNGIEYWRGGLASLLALAVLWLGMAPAVARINVVTLPGRDSVQLTIYNSADLTLVKETRVLTFRKGLNRLEFSWANTLIDPTSVEFRALTHADAVDVLDVSFPPRVANTLEWRIQSEVAGEVQVEIRYFTSGITWAADYVAEATKAEKAMTLAGAVRVTNNSGEDYENAQVRLVVGVIRLVEKIVELAQTGAAGRTRAQSAAGTSHDAWKPSMLCQGRLLWPDAEGAPGRRSQEGNHQGRHLASTSSTPSKAGTPSRPAGRSGCPPSRPRTCPSPATTSSRRSGGATR